MTAEYNDDRDMSFIIYELKYLMKLKPIKYIKLQYNKNIRQNVEFRTYLIKNIIMPKYIPPHHKYNRFTLISCKFNTLWFIKLHIRLYWFQTSFHNTENTKHVKVTADVSGEGFDILKEKFLSWQIIFY